MELVHREDVGGVALITLDDPDRRNALSVALCEQLVAVLDDVESSDSISSLVITGAGKAFCAGADLSELGSSHEEGLRKIYAGFLRLASSPLPTVAAVNGPAVGAGMNLALAADVRMTSSSARFDTRFLALGIHPGGGHTWLLQQLVGPQVAKAMVLFGEVIGGEEAAAFGLAWRCVPDEALIDAALELAARAAKAPRELVLRTKATMADVSVMDQHHPAVERELETQLWSMQQPAFAERLAEMQQKISRDA